MYVCECVSVSVCVCVCHKAFTESKELLHIPIHELSSMEQNIIKMELGLKEDEFVELMTSKRVQKMSKERLEKEFAELYGPDASLHPEDAITFLCARNPCLIFGS